MLGNLLQNTKLGRKGQKLKRKLNKRSTKAFKLLRSFQRSPFYLPLLIFLPSYSTLSVAVYLLERHGRDSHFRTLLDSFWWAIVTASTLGYGDIVPHTVGGRVLAAATTLLGIAVTSLFSAALASLYIQRNSLRRRGLMDFPKLKDHLVICGWKPKINSLLKDMIESNADLTDEGIVLISNIESQTFETIIEEKELKGLKFIRGDYFSETYLKRASVDKARKVIVLADTYDSKTPAEADAKTVLAVLKIKGIARDIYTCAELLDPKYEVYLRRSFCDEIILVRDAGRQLLVASTKVDGMSHVIQQLLFLHERDQSQQGHVHINAETIPTELIGREYKDLCELYKNNKSILLGLIENSGTPKEIQSSLIRKAQKEHNVRNIIKYMRQAKDIELNKPNFMPDEDYIVKPFSKLILLERQN
ncbi:ion channel [Candidatus Haliotispira prima]|uniref:Ion channel n=1 Tax=Candidatus Haliotispira prima TaxID=3034016 RepID=A0ABY8MHI3_9SPIO|nr:ion channel [Candidatus Haliotispira prima]